MLNNGFVANKGFTFLESLLAIFILTVGSGGAFVLVNQNIVSANSAGFRLTAVYLAQEGIEVVRAIKDSNFLKIRQGIAGVDWDTGLSGCALGCEADYDDSTLIIFGDRYLKIGSGFYNYDFGENAVFKRKIKILPAAEILEVSVEVSWRERGIGHQFTVKENLYKWQ